MKIKLLLVLLLTCSIMLNAQNIGIGTSTPASSAKLEITDANRGLLIPRVALTMTTAAGPITAPSTSLMVYNTATVADVTPGFYFWDGAAWVRFTTTGTDWSLTGNNGVTGANFLGTINAADLIFRTTNTQRMVVASGGNVGVGDASPAALFTVGNGDLFQVVSTGHARGINGTAALPSFSFTGDTDNGMYLSTTNEVSFSTAGTQRAVIASNGNVGIGDASPAALFTVGGGDLFQVISTGHARGISGTAALPSFSFTGDTDNGMYLSTADELSFSTAATQRAVISATGNVGIAATTPATKLDINGDWSYREGTALVLVNGPNGTLAPGATSLVRITGPTGAFALAGFTGGVNGKVLTIVNTTTNYMTIQNNAAATATDGIYTTGGGGNLLVLTAQYSSVTFIYNSTLGRWIVTSCFTPTSATAWSLSGNTGTSDPAAPVTYGTSTIAAGEDFIGTTDANDVVIATNNLERFRIKQTTGNVGIGDASPAGLFTVGNGDLFQVVSTGHARGINGTAALPSFAFTGDTDNGMYLSNTNELSFSTAGTQRMAISSGGNVGIGTANPIYGKLQVVGYSIFTATNAALTGASSAAYIRGNDALSTATTPDYTWYNSDQTGMFHPTTTAIGFCTNGFGEIMRISGNRLGIGVTIPGGQLELSLDQGRKPGTATWVVVSDERLKNIEGPYEKGLKELMQLKAIVYHYKNAEGRNFPKEVLQKQNVGFSAQEVQKVFPEAVGTDDDGYLNLNVHAILIAYLNAIKEQQVEIESLRSENTTYKTELFELKKEVGEIKKMIKK